MVEFTLSARDIRSLRKMDRETTIRKFESLRIGQSGGKAAPHKPLLILYAIGALLKDKRRLLPYSEIDERLGYLLSEFGSESSGEKAYVPFWRLQTDEIWEVTDANKIGLTSKGDPHVSDLVHYDVSGGFKVQVCNQFRMDTDFAFEIAQMMLDRHFSADLHAKVLYWTWIDCRGPRAN